MKKIIFPIIIFILVAFGSFYGGMKYGQNGNKSANSPTAKLFQQNGGQYQRNVGGTGGTNNVRAGANFTTGNVIAKDDKSFTLKLQNGGSKIIFFSSATQFMKTATGSIEELKIGDNVMTNGNANSDGSMTAETIQLRQSASDQIHQQEQVQQVQ